MARRLYIDEPISRLATWSARLGLFGLAVAALSVVILRSGLLEVGPALATFAAALGCAALAILLALGAFAAIWRQGLSGLGRALRGLILGIALLAYPAYLGSKALKLPPISDISTDTVNPPRFVALARERPADRVAYPGEKAAALQHKAYPDIVPLQESLPVRSAYEVTLAVITKRRWAIAEARPPVGARGTGTIEATARTPLMGFRDDIVIRITPLGSGSDAGARIDLRSASRIGSVDFGANAKRLRALMEDIDDAASNAPEPKPEPEPAKKPAPKRKPKK
ncbi:MAG: DUF1499 domain-containing protein [Rhodopseudomonas sp.]|nr:DUF1499 domain-containing protein [Rhodopseudomonas sp.]